MTGKGDHWSPAQGGVTACLALASTVSAAGWNYV